MSYQEKEILISNQGYGESTICCMFNRRYNTQYNSDPVVWVCVYDPNRLYDKQEIWDSNHALAYIEPPCINCKSRSYRESSLSERRDCVYAAWKGWMVDPPLKLEGLMDKLGNLHLVKVSPKTA